MEKIAFYRLNDANLEFPSSPDHFIAMNSATWDEQTLITYLAFATTGRRNYLLPLVSYPDRIKLESFHQHLSKLDAGTEKDGLERYALGGLQLEFKGRNLSMNLCISDVMVGARDYIPGETIDEAIEQAFKENISTRFAVHSHPVRTFPLLRSILRHFHNNFLAFSPPDIYGSLLQNNATSMVGLVMHYGNLFLFRSKETLPIPRELLTAGIPPEYSEWGLRMGIIRKKRFLGSEITLLYPANPLKMNKTIAREHNLALYEGKPGGDLIRLHPPISSE